MRKIWRIQQGFSQTAGIFGSKEEAQRIIDVLVNPEERGDFYAKDNFKIVSDVLMEDGDYEAVKNGGLMIMTIKYDRRDARTFGPVFTVRETPITTYSASLKQWACYIEPTVNVTKLADGFRANIFFVGRENALERGKEIWRMSPYNSFYMLAYGKWLELQSTDDVAKYSFERFCDGDDEEAMDIIAEHNAALAML